MNLRLDPTGTKIEARFEYHPDTVAKIRSIPGARFRGSDKVWILPKDMNTWEDLKMFAMVNIDKPLIDWAKQFNQQATLNMEHKKHTAVYTDIDWMRYDFKTKPMEHQVKALDLCWQNKAFALFMEMGTGKTKVMVDLLSFSKQPDQASSIVICPLSVCSVWKNEIAKHSNNLSVELLTGSRYQREEALKKKADVYVINYEGLRVIKDEIVKYKWHTAICDESQRIKNRTAQQSKIVYEIGRMSTRRYILSGTPIVNNPLDAFGQFKFLDEAILGSNYYAFANRYAIFSIHGRVRYPIRYVNVPELANKIAPWSYRVTKDECLDLPDKIYETRYVELSSKARAIYKSLATELVAEVGSNLVTAPIILTKLLRFSQICAGFVGTEDGNIEEVGDEKLGVLAEILGEVEGKVVVWVKFKHELKMVCRLLEKLHIVYVTLSGDTPQKEREANLSRFRDGDVRVFVAQLEAGGVGIDLTAASTCVYLSNSYSFGTRDQSESRIHRHGQKNKCVYVDIIARGTIDEKIVQILRTKKDLAAVLTGDANRQEFIQSLVTLEE